MQLRASSIAAPVAHLIGPGKIKIVNGRLAFSTGQGTPQRLDLSALKTIRCYGPVGVTDDALLELFEHGVEVAWLTAGGHRCRGRLVQSRTSDTTLRVLQHRALTDPQLRLELARDIVRAKIESQLDAARHYQRQGRLLDESGVARLRELSDTLDRYGEIDQVRGVEGVSSAVWFSLLGKLLCAPWTFTTRVRRPPTDPVNALLSLGYTWLTSRVVAACEAEGLEVCLGALHENRPGRPSLACDLVEPLRVPAVDRWVIQMCNGNRLTLEHFRAGEHGVRLTKEIFPQVLTSWEEHWGKQQLQRRLDMTLRQFVAKVRKSCADRGLPAAAQEEGG